MNARQTEKPPGAVESNWFGPVPRARAGAARRVEESVVYMRDHLDRPLHVAALAELTRVSPSHFFSLFKRQTGYAPINFFIHLKIRRACELLDETALKVKEVAAAVGYDDQLYFSRAFKLLAHVAPTHYRRLAAGAREEIKETLTPSSGPCPGRTSRAGAVESSSPSGESWNHFDPDNLNGRIQTQESCHAENQLPTE